MSQRVHVSAAILSQSLDKKLDVLVSAFESTTKPEILFALVTGILVALPPEVIMRPSYIHQISKLMSFAVSSDLHNMGEKDH